MKPAAAGPSDALSSSGPAFMNVCSLSMITSTAAANPPPWASVNSAPAGRPGATIRSGVARRPERRARSAIAIGTMIRLRSGPATIPSASADCPEAIPTATATANETRESASISSSTK
jgi:hypothetical protein